jgi:hypothetical protein
MGYDGNECFACFHQEGGNNPCKDEGNYLETCLTCIDKLCGSTTGRVISALMNFDWNPSGRCTECNKSGITISILLCDYHTTERNFLDDESTIDYACFLCDYEGKCNYDENDTSETWIWLPYCNNCTTKITEYCIKKITGIPEIWSGNGYIGECSRCKLSNPVEELPLCNYHSELIK